MDMQKIVDIIARNLVYSHGDVDFDFSKLTPVERSAFGSEEDYLDFLAWVGANVDSPALVEWGRKHKQERQVTSFAKKILNLK